MPPYAAIGTIHHTNSALSPSPNAMFLSDFSCHGLPDLCIPTQEQSLAQKYSPTPTMTTGSYTDPETYEFDQVMGCSEASTDEPLFYSDTTYGSNDDHHDVQINWKNYITPHQMQSLEPLLTDLQNPGS